MSTSTTTVRGLDGETFTLYHAPGASLAELKQLIAEHTGIDPAQQHVSRGGRTLVDDNDDDAQGCASAARCRAEDELAASLEQRYSRASSIGAAAIGRGGRWSRSCSRPRPCGLQNIGGTSCYLNAALQALLTVEQLARPDFYTSFLTRTAPKSDGNRCSSTERRWRLAKAVAAFVAEVSTAEEAAEQDVLAGLHRCHTPEYLHALLSNGVTGLAGAERFHNGAPADCSECWDLLMRGLDDSAGNVELSTSERNVAASRNVGGVRDLFCGTWSSIAEAGNRHSDRTSESVFWSLTLLRAGSIYRCLAANGIFPLSTSTSTAGPPAKRPKPTPLGQQPLGSASRNDADAYHRIKVLPEYLMLQFKSDPGKRRQQAVTFPIEGLDLSKYMLQSFARTQNVELQDVLIENQEQEQVEAGTAVYDLVAVVYYHSSRGPLQAIDGYPLSGSTQNQSPRKHAHQDKRRNAASNTPAARSKQAGHYTAAVFRPFQSTRRRQSADQDDPSGKKRGVQQDRNGSWWVCDDDQVRLLSDPNRLVANEVQILMYHRRNQLKDSNASGPTPWSSSQAASRGTTMDRQGPNLTRTRVLFGEDGSIVSTVREPAGAGW